MLHIVLEAPDQNVSAHRSLLFKFICLKIHAYTWILYEYLYQDIRSKKRKMSWYFLLKLSFLKSP